MEPLRRDAQVWAIYSLILVLAVLQAGVGGLLPYFQAEFGLSHTQLSVHITAVACGGLLAGLFGDRLRRRLGRPAALMVTAVVGAASGLLLGAGPSELWTIAGSCLIGIAVGFALIVGQGLLVARFRADAARLIGEYNLAYALGAVMAMFGLPLLAAGLLGWRALTLAPVAVLLALVLPWLWQTGRASADLDAAAAGGAASPWVLRRPWVSFVVLALCTAVEWSFLYWTATYLVDAAGHPAETAAQATAVLWAAVLLARAAGTRLLPRLGPARMLTASLLLTAVATVALLFAESLAMAFLAAGIAGLAVANLFPACVALVVSGAGEQADSAVARATVWSAIAIIGFPLLIGAAADAMGLRTAFWAVPLTSGLALLAVFAAGSHRAAPTPEPRLAARPSIVND